MATHSIIVGGISYDIDDGTSIILEALDGIGLPPFHRLMESGPQQHGATDRGFRLDPRTFRFRLVLLADTEADLDTLQYAWAGRFKPSNTAMAYEVVRNGKTRRLDCFCNGGLGYNTESQQRAMYREVVEMVAPDPVWYDPMTIPVVFGVGTGGGAFVIPLVIPLAIGASSVSQVTDITYTGTWIEYPRIRIDGPINDCVITNTTTDEKLDFTGFNLADGHYLWIDCRYGQKLVLYDATTYSEAANAIDHLTNDSDLATFHLDADPEAPGGVNTIQVTGTNADAGTAISFQYNNRFIGI